jgi:hypothetical protein
MAWCVPEVYPGNNLYWLHVSVINKAHVVRSKKKGVPSPSFVLFKPFPRGLGPIKPLASFLSDPELESCSFVQERKGESVLWGNHPVFQGERRVPLKKERRKPNCVLYLVQISLVGGGRAMAMRTIAAKLKEKIPAAVQRVFASSRVPVRSPSRSSPAEVFRLMQSIDLPYCIAWLIFARRRRKFLAVMEAG